MKNVKTILIFVFLLACNLLVSAAIPAAERQALIDLYNSTNGANWGINTNWLGAAGTENTWLGVNTDAGNTTVLKLLLQNNNLVGTLPDSLGNLSNLQNFQLFSNQLTGSIPSSLGNLSKLQILYLTYNQLTGSIPSSLGNLSNLSDISLGSNQLTGSIPTELANLSNLLNLSLEGNQLTGTIPTQLGNLTNLTWLSLFSNQLTGSIPTSLTNLTNLGPSNWSFQIGWNALHTSDDALIAFLNSKNPFWASTQTIAPTNVSAVPGSSSVTVSWTPITYTGDTGGYRVFFATIIGGPYTFYAQTLNKSASSQLVSGLTNGIPYYFVVRTRTDVHANNQNVVDSENSDEVTATPLSSPTIAVTSPNGGENLMVGSNHNITWTSIAANVNIDYSTNSGGSWNSVVTGTANDGTHPWTVPSTPSTACLVRVSDAANAAVNDASNAVFTIALSDDIYEDNDTLAAAAVLVPGAYSGLVLLDEDYFKVYVQGGKDLQVGLSGGLLAGGGGDMDIELYNASGVLLVASCGGSTNEMLCLSNLAAGWYFIRNFWFGQAYGYTLTIASGDLPLGEINGRVTDIRGSGIANVWVMFYEPGGDWNLVRGYVLTDSNGDYSFAYMAGDHKVLFNANYPTNQVVGSYVNEWYNDVATLGAAQTLTTAAGSSLTGIDAVLGDAGMVTGLVTGPEGQPLHYAYAQAYDASGTFYASTYTLSDGTYRLSGIPASGNYIIRFRPPGGTGYAVEWYNDKSWSGAADAVAVVLGGETSNINAQLDYGGTISGQVTDAVSGLPIANVTVSARDETNIVINSALTDASGQYTIYWVPACNVKLYFNAGTTGYVSEWYNNKASFATADVVPVAAGQNVTGIDAHLSAVTISGTVTLNGSPLVNVTMSGLPGNPATDASGIYSAAIGYNWSGTVTPTLSGIVFTPATSTYANVTTDQVTDYTAALTLTNGLVVTVPNSTSLWEKGKTYAITWVKQGVQNANVKILLYKGTATLVKTIIGTTPNDGSYDWLVPTTLAVGSTYFIRVKTVDNLISDDSGKFSIIVPTITVTAPASGSIWVKNATKAITWAKQGTQDANVKIQLYKGLVKTLDITLSAPNSGTYDWLVPSTLVNVSTYSIRITTLDGKVIGKSAKFTIASGLIRVTQPVAGNKLIRGTSKVITWFSEGAVNANVKIHLYRGTNKVQDISLGTPTADGTFSWDIPANLALATTYSIKVTAVDNLVAGKSGTFAIIAGIITVTQPTAGTIWQRGVGHTITWTKEGPLLNANVKIQLVKGTTVVSTLATTTANDGSFDWTIAAGQALAANYKIRIITVDNLVKADSDVFTISSTAGLILLSPNGAGILKAAGTQAIRWSDDPDVLEVKLEFSRDNGGTFTTIADHVADAGSYDWKVPVNFTRNAIVRVSDSNGKLWREDGLLEFSFKFNYGGIGQEPGAVFWFGSRDPKSPSYGFARIEIGSAKVQFGGFNRAIEPLAGDWHELRVRFNFRRDTAEIRLDDRMLFENAALYTTPEHFFQPCLVLQSGGDAPLAFAMDDLAINIVQLDNAGEDRQLFNALTDNFDRYDEKANALQNCWQWQNTNGAENKVELNLDTPDNKALRLQTATGKQLMIYLPFALPDKVPFDISDKNIVIENQ